MVVGPVLVGGGAVPLKRPAADLGTSQDSNRAGSELRLKRTYAFYGVGQQCIINIRGVSCLTSSFALGISLPQFNAALREGLPKKTTKSIAPQLEFQIRSISEDGKIASLSDRGAYQKQEDRFNLMQTELFGKAATVAVVCDGHGGSAISEYLSQVLSAKVLDAIHQLESPNPSSIISCIQGVFQEVDAQIKLRQEHDQNKERFTSDLEKATQELEVLKSQKAEPSSVLAEGQDASLEFPVLQHQIEMLQRTIDIATGHLKSLELGALPRNEGSTAVLTLKIDDKIYVANVGDSRAMIYLGTDLFSLTEDATLRPGNRFYQEMEDADALYQDRSGNYRVKGAHASSDPNLALAVPRAFGDVQYRSADGLALVGLGNPCDVTAAIVRPQDQLVLMSDGVTGLTRAQLLESLQAHKNPADQANALITLANQKGISDNKTVVVWHF